MGTEVLTDLAANVDIKNLIIISFLGLLAAVITLHRAAIMRKDIEDVMKCYKITTLFHPYITKKIMIAVIWEILILAGLVALIFAILARSGELIFAVISAIIGISSLLYLLEIW